MRRNRLRLVLRRITHTATKFFRRAASLRKLLFMLACALACIAGVYAYGLWQDGVRAGENAQEILRVSGFASLNPSGEEGYRPPGEPAADPNALDGLFDSVLQGYSVIARLDIPAIGISLPVLSGTTDAALKYSVCYYTGPGPGGEGNLVITGHNYASGAHFGNLDKVREGDTVSLTDQEGNTCTYSVYKTELVTPDDAQALADTEYDREVTLLTCEKNANRRLLVRCREAEGQ